jgi:hypothetical protein
MGQQQIWTALKILEKETMVMSSSQTMRELLLSYAFENEINEENVLKEAVKIFKKNLEYSQELEFQLSLYYGTLNRRIETDKQRNQLEIVSNQISQAKLKKSFKNELEETRNLKHEEIKVIKEDYEKDQSKISKNILLI